MIPPTQCYTCGQSLDSSQTAMAQSRKVLELLTEVENLKAANKKMHEALGEASKLQQFVDGGGDNSFVPGSRARRMQDVVYEVLKTQREVYQLTYTPSYVMQDPGASAQNSSSSFDPNLVFSVVGMEQEGGSKKV